MFSVFLQIITFCDIMMYMKNSPEVEYGKETAEDKEFFSNLAQKHGLREDIHSEHLVLVRSDGKQEFIPRWRQIPQAGGKPMAIEQYIQKLLKQE